MLEDQALRMFACGVPFSHSYDNRIFYPFLCGLKFSLQRLGGGGPQNLTIQVYLYWGPGDELPPSSL